MKLFSRHTLVLCALASLFAGCELIFPYDLAQGPAQQDGGNDVALDLGGDGNAKIDAIAGADRPALHEAGLPPDIASGHDLAFDAGDAGGESDLPAADTGARDVAPADMADLLMVRDLAPSVCRKELDLWECTDNGAGCLSSCGSSYITCAANGDCALFHDEGQYGCNVGSALQGCALCDESLADGACWRP